MSRCKHFLRSKIYKVSDFVERFLNSVVWREYNSNYLIDYFQVKTYSFKCKLFLIVLYYDV